MLTATQHSYKLQKNDNVLDQHKNIYISLSYGWVAIK